MNQILAVENKQKNEKNRKSKNKTADIKKVITVFCVIAILFGIAITGQGVYAIVNNFKSDSSTTVAEQNISIDSDTNTGKVIISGTVPDGVQKITYNWNEKKKKTITKNGETQINEEIDLPVGNNKLDVTIVDMKNNSTPYTKEFTADSTLPQLALSLGDDGTKIKIVAKDTVALSYVTYQWDDEDVQTIYPEEGSEAQLETEIEAPAGKHNLTVIAVNTSNKTTTKTQEVDGVDEGTKPSVKAAIDPADRSKIIFSASDQIGLKNLSFTINGQKYVLPAEGDNKTELQYTFEVKQGHYSITVEAENVNGQTESQDFTYDY